MFGTRPSKPMLCNVSVGISVFGVSPNCLFLFHDAESHVVYVLQCKGLFNALLLKGVQHLVLDKNTRWDDLPQLNYIGVLRMQIPASTKLDKVLFQLQSGRQFRFDDIYSGHLSKEFEEELLGNDDNIKSAILTATTRGQSQEIHKWAASRPRRVSWHAETRYQR